MARHLYDHDLARFYRGSDGGQRADFGPEPDDGGDEYSPDRSEPSGGAFDSDVCQCDLVPTPQEDLDNCCFACGKPLR